MGRSVYHCWKMRTRYYSSYLAFGHFIQCLKWRSNNFWGGGAAFTKFPRQNSGKPACHPYTRAVLILTLVQSMNLQRALCVKEDFWRFPARPTALSQALIQPLEFALPAACGQEGCLHGSATAPQRVQRRLHPALLPAGGEGEPAKRPRRPAQSPHSGDRGTQPAAAGAGRA